MTKTKGPLQRQSSTIIPSSSLYRSHFTSCYTLRDSSGMHLLQRYRDIRTAQEALRDKDVKPTMVCPQALNRRGTGVKRPRTICKGGLQVCHAETTYDRVPSVAGDFMACNHKDYADVSRGVLCRDFPATRCYRETT